MATALASLSDLEARGVDVSDAARAQAAIDDASALIHAETHNVWISGDGLVADVPAVALTICCKVAQRVLSNPTGIQTESIVGYSVTYGDAYLRNNEAETLRTVAGIGGLSAIRLAHPWAPQRATLSALLDDEYEIDGDVFYGS